MTPGPPLGPRSPRVRRLRHLATRRRARDDEERFVVEGAQLLADALATGAPIEEVYVDAERPSDVAEQAAAAGVEVVALAPGVLSRVADTVSPQPVVGVARRVDVALDDVRDASLLVVLVDVRDPGNLGTVVRSAEAAGGHAVICCKGSVDPFGPKAVRASAGSVFRMGLVDGGEPEEVLEHMGTWGVRRLGTQADGGQPYDRADLTARTAFVLGNEAHGLPAGLDRHLDGTVTIPMAGRIESLNVGMAATVLCFEAARQRRAGGS